MVNVYYVLCFDSVLDIINNFIKLRIVALFDDFFLYPFRQSSMSSYIGAKISISKFRKDKIVIDQNEIKQMIAIKREKPVVPEYYKDLENQVISL